LLLACALLLAFVRPLAAQQPVGAADTALRLLPGDALRLAIRDEPELTGDYAVARDGTVLLPLIGQVQVVGVSFEEVERRVRRGYAEQLADPSLSLSPLVRVAVLGEVRLPGLHLLDGRLDVAQALARAGGLTPSANGRIRLLRDGRAEWLTAERAQAELPDGMLPGDQLIIERRSWARENSPVLIGAGTSVLVAAITALLVR
jgi:polysaccharide export outer membrane protein